MKYRTGAIIDKTRVIEKEYFGVTILPPKILTDISHLPILNQGDQEACVGHAGANGVNYDYFNKTKTVPNSSARWNYGVAKLIDGNTQDGTSATSMFNGWKKYFGSATINTVPNNVTLPISQYTELTITPIETADAQKYPITNEVDIPNPTCAQLQSLIAEYGVALIAVEVDEETWMTQDGNVSLKPGTAGGHEVLLFGYDTTNLNGDVRFFILNSWGSQWGESGTGTFLWSDYKNNVYDAMSITVNTPSVTITRSPSTATETLGQLRTSDGEFGCDTLELPWLNDQLNISCVPTGTYTCVWKLMLDLGEWHYELQGTAPRSGIFIHEGNSPADTKGCILLGGLVQGENVINSKEILTAFETKMGKNSFNLVIQ